MPCKYIKYRVHFHLTDKNLIDFWLGNLHCNHVGYKYATSSRLSQKPDDQKHWNKKKYKMIYVKYRLSFPFNLIR